MYEACEVLHQNLYCNTAVQHCSTPPEIQNFKHTIQYPPLNPRSTLLYRVIMIYTAHKYVAIITVPRNFQKFYRIQYIPCHIIHEAKYFFLPILGDPVVSSVANQSRSHYIGFIWHWQDHNLQDIMQSN